MHMLIHILTAHTIYINHKSTSFNGGGSYGGGTLPSFHQSYPIKFYQNICCKSGHIRRVPNIFHTTCKQFHLPHRTPILTPHNTILCWHTNLSTKAMTFITPSTIPRPRTKFTHRHTLHRRPTVTMVVAPTKPIVKPASPCFSSGPCKKRPGYDFAIALADAPLGRSHRSKLGKAKLQEAITRTKQILQIPDDYRVAIVPASDTGAVEMAMWSMLGALPVDLCYWESFGKGWLTDAASHLKLDNLTEFAVQEYGRLPDLSAVNKHHDVIFTFNGTTSGVRVPEGLDFIADDRTGLSICDATSAVFAMHVPWNKIDVLTYSWQKVLGGEAAHGMLVLSPRAVERLETYVPPRPLPKVFRMTKKGKIDEALFKGNVINTVSMMCVEDYLDALKWCEEIGGLEALVKRSKDNLAVIEAFVDRNPWAHFLAKEANIRSSTSVCLTLDLEKDKVKEMEQMLADEGVAYDINSYRDAPPGLRIWCGATVEVEDLKALTTWIEWAFDILTNK